jgi:hypothetical protein
MTITSPLKAIRQNCIECCGGSKHEVSLCPATDAAPVRVIYIYSSNLSPNSATPFRFGKNPYNKRTLSDEQREAARVRLQNYHEANKTT